ncbi:MAG TPA: hypothetical protein VMR81_04785 [Patescibacteria group bacterium]|nr:hypothetical protein [Patescibacteria group bacterium]
MKSQAEEARRSPLGPSEAFLPPQLFDPSLWIPVKKLGDNVPIEIYVTGLILSDTSLFWQKSADYGTETIFIVDKSQITRIDCKPMVPFLDAPDWVQEANKTLPKDDEMMFQELTSAMIDPHKTFAQLSHQSVVYTPDGAKNDILVAHTVILRLNHPKIPFIPPLIEISDPVGNAFVDIGELQERRTLLVSTAFSIETRVESDGKMPDMNISTKLISEHEQRHTKVQEGADLQSIGLQLFGVRVQNDKTSFNATEAQLLEKTTLRLRQPTENF